MWGRPRFGEQNGFIEPDIFESIMIYDHIKNIGLYKGLTPALDLALEYIENVTPEVEVGTHPLVCRYPARARRHGTHPLQAAPAGGGDDSVR